MLLMLKVAILTKSLCVAVPLGAPPKRSKRSALFRLALFYRWKEMENPELRMHGLVLEVAGLQFISRTCCSQYFGLPDLAHSEHTNPAQRTAISFVGTENHFS